jgi:PPK2 family polyphosphate:nucleotide phosphotransferase
MNHAPYHVPSGKKIRLSSYDCGETGKFTSKEDAADKLAKDVERLAELQDILYAHDRKALLLIFQAMDAAGKDGVIKHVMSGVNPQGCQVVAFKAPSAEELDHDYLWRCARQAPERGRIGIFNRSYYEEVLVVRVHPDILAAEKLPADNAGQRIWKRRFEEINNFEKYLVDNGTTILKFFLHVSKKEQKKRFLERIDTPEKNWKFSAADIKERTHWSEYMKAYEEAISATSTPWAPWFVVPADKKWFTRALVADIIVKTLEGMNLSYPKLSREHLEGLAKAKKELEAEA